MSFDTTKHKVISCLAGYLLLFLWPFSVQSLTVVERPFEELVALADHIIVGKVERMTSAKQANSEKIYTYVTFSDLDIIKGDYDDIEYIVKHRGGIVDDLGEVFPGMPQFEQGQRYIIFIRHNFHDFFPIVGIHQGIRKIVWDERQQTDIVIAVEGETINQISSDLNAIGRTAVEREPENIPLNDFLYQIQSQLNEFSNQQ